MPKLVNMYILPRIRYGDSHILDSPLIILTTKFNSKKKLSALNEKGQKNMPTKILIRKNKAPFMNTF